MRLTPNTPKGHELKAHQEFVDANLNKSFTSLYGGFLTPAEIKKVIDGRDYWMDKDEVLARFESRSGGAYLDVPASESTTIPTRRGRKPKAC